MAGLITVADRPLPICHQEVTGSTIKRAADSRNYPELPEKATAMENRAGDNTAGPGLSPLSEGRPRERTGKQERLA